MENKMITFECPASIDDRVEKYIEKENKLTASIGFRLTKKHFMISAIDFYLQSKNKV